MGGYGWLRWLQENPKRKWWFFVTDKQTDRHFIIIYISSPTSEDWILRLSSQLFTMQCTPRKPCDERHCCSTSSWNLSLTFLFCLNIFSHLSSYTLRNNQFCVKTSMRAELYRQQLLLIFQSLNSYTALAKHSSIWMLMLAWLHTSPFTVWKFLDFICLCFCHWLTTTWHWLAKNRSSQKPRLGKKIW